MDRLDHMSEISLPQAQKQQGPYPMEHIKHVDQPTTAITEAIQRIDMRDTAYGLAGRGEYGPALQKGVRNSLPGKYPLSAAQKDVIDHIALMEPNPVATVKAPVPQDPGTLYAAHQVGWVLSQSRYHGCLPGAHVRLLQSR